MSLLSYYNYWIAIVLMMVGLYVVMSHANLVKKMIGLNVFQVAVFMLFISLGKVRGGTAPILDPAFTTYSHPLPHVLILTAIVVGVATTALGLALAVRIHEAYGTTEEQDALKRDDAESGAR
ncbi:cation:proton antiporter subunit C [Sinimarinibacterium thermocellulolyticum]|uniref:Cation:proton antiporter subunit C n=1 Tax=Sinimarinibacterium thermocellulolyticum TaxID=3170016 RepID=A0ABV2A7L9_9GAMM